MNTRTLVYYVGFVITVVDASHHHNGEQHDHVEIEVPAAPSGQFSSWVATGASGPAFALTSTWG